MKLYMVRHGESVANAELCHCGQLDTPLSENGKAQAISCARLLEGKTFDKIYSSDLSRASDTQRLAFPVDESKVERLELLREADVGALAGVPIALCAEKFEKYEENKFEYNFTPYGGENYDEFYVRVKSFLDMVASSDCENVIAFTHGGFIQVTCDVILGTYRIKDFIKCDNCAIFVFEYLDNKWKMVTANFTGKL